MNHGNNIRLDGDPCNPDAWLTPTDAPLHFAVDGTPKYEFVPYFEIGDESFTCYPVFRKCQVPRVPRQIVPPHA